MTEREVLVLGGGVAGLSAGVLLQRRGRDAMVVEREPVVGGLARTIECDGFRFDLGGHRFYSKQPAVREFFAEVVGKELIEVDRRSSIHFRDRYITYPITPANALRNVGFGTAVRIGLDLARISVRRRRPHPRSLEGWMLQNYGSTLFRTFFQVYAEKVWGMGAEQIDAGLAAQRVKGLDLWATMRNALLPRSATAVESMVERFRYPKGGFGRFGERLAETLSSADGLRTETEPLRIRHRNGRITSVELNGPEGPSTIHPGHLVSSIPITALLRLLDPAPPSAVQEAARGLGFRAVVFVAVLIDRPSVRNESWIYFPSSDISFGRVTEPRNWSEDLVPAGKTSVMTEHFCDPHDDTWNLPDDAIAQRTIGDLVDRLGLIRREEVLGHVVVRTQAAYPRMDIHHRRRLTRIERWLDRLTNLQVIGRTGMYRYHNTDHAIETAMACVDRLDGGPADPRLVNTAFTYHEEVQTA